MTSRIAAVVFSLVALIAASGCSSPPQNTAQTIPAGPKPPDELAAKLVGSYLNSLLKDPDSVKQLSIQPAKEIRLNKGFLYGGGSSGAHLICFQYNAKNSYGGYVGLQQDALVVRWDGNESSMPSIITDVVRTTMFSLC